MVSGLLFASVVISPLIGLAFFFYQRRLGKHRGVLREQFISAFESTEVPSQIPAAVYDYYKSLAVSKEFSVRRGMVSRDDRCGRPKRC